MNAGFSRCLLRHPIRGASFRPPTPFAAFTASPRLFSSTNPRLQDNGPKQPSSPSIVSSLFGDPNPSAVSESVTKAAQDADASARSSLNSMQELSQSLLSARLGKSPTPGQSIDDLQQLKQDLKKTEVSAEPYHFHIFSHKRNTHITVTKPNREVIISLSCGNIGIRKAKRKEYHSAYQLAAYTLQRLYHQGWHEKITRLEVILRGFGQGRDAAVKVLLGAEGAPLRNKIIRVADATRLKIGGQRAKNPRRI